MTWDDVLKIIVTVWVISSILMPFIEKIVKINEKNEKKRDEK